ncbi:hypothetical protein BY996DRAFT_6425190 [Phakopsora pachyrhizi]|nr:hypothetical protein BY996DRAFT_6425190 [Phakopsora pachyrhizi]
MTDVNFVPKCKTTALNEDPNYSTKINTALKKGATHTASQRNAVASSVASTLVSLRGDGCRRQSVSVMQSLLPALTHARMSAQQITHRSVVEFKMCMLWTSTECY